jgi:hypothetical protein
MDGLKEKKVEAEELTPPLARQILVGVDAATYERVVNACTEQGFWRSFTTYKDQPVWTFTQALGAEHVVDVNVYAPRDSGNPADEEAPVWTFTQALGASHVVDVNVYTPSNDPACCWAEAVVFQRDAENPEALNEVNCIMGDDDPFTTPWRFELGDGAVYELRFTER